MATNALYDHDHARYAHTHTPPRSKSFMDKTSFAAISQLLVLDLVLFLLLFHTVNLSLGKVLTARTDGILDC